MSGGALNSLSPWEREGARSAQPSGKGEGSASYWRGLPSPDLAPLGHPLPVGEGL